MDFSRAVTFRIPLASTSNDTSIWGIPRGIGGIPVKLNSPNLLLSLVLALSPSNTCIVTAGWLSLYVEKTCFLHDGIVEFLGIITVITSPAVSNPKDKGATSNNKRSEVFSDLISLRTAAWTAAPYATASSGLIDLDNSLPLKKSESIVWIFGILVDPPTNTTSSILFLLNWESFKTFSTGSIVFLNKSIHNSSNLALVKDEKKSIPSYKESISIEVWVEAERVRLALSQAVLNLLNDLGFSVISCLCFLLNSCTKCFTNLVSKSSPPKCVSPAVAFTSKIPSSIFNIETSNVPPPKSKIKIFFSFSDFLSKP